MFAGMAMLPAAFILVKKLGREGKEWNCHLHREKKRKEKDYSVIDFPLEIKNLALKDFEDWGSSGGDGGVWEENAVHTIIDVDEEKKDSESGHQEIPLSDTEQESIAISDDSERGHQEILLSDTEEESIAFSDDYSVAEEFLLPSTDSSPWNDSESMSNSDDQEKSFSTSTESSLSTVLSTDDGEEDSSIQSSTSSMLSAAEDFPLPSIDSYEEKLFSTSTESSLSTVSSTDDEEEYLAIQSSTSSMLSAAEEFSIVYVRISTFILEN
ncbi:hypothetical protein SLEP1_g1364 [Rubroshorea leprosula]|uniref:Uncharacterized protein n=1 Tax=Rubroshorea leprosula TaxID=152421 RepID=A0AAV5HI70_9ROSI|nr:hypothetical protein SLEP1_g1364 [Rubroshorea leprosula]